jgi:polyisoprenoid-binding protein YceI
MYKYLTNSFIATILTVATVFLWAAGSETPASTSKSLQPNSFEMSGITQDTGVRLVVAPNGNTVRYLVREQLAGFDFPNDAVGETSDVTGSVVFNAEGDVISEESRVVVDITGLTSDRERRDGYIQRRTLESETYPTVELVPFLVRGLQFPLPTSGTGTFDIVGNLTIRDVTEVTSWRVTAQFGDGIMTGTARTEFTFGEFGMEKPSVASVLSVADAIRLEFDFTMNVENLASL